MYNDIMKSRLHLSLTILYNETFRLQTTSQVPLTLHLQPIYPICFTHTTAKNIHIRDNEHGKLLLHASAGKFRLTRAPDFSGYVTDLFLAQSALWSGYLKFKKIPNKTSVTVTCIMTCRKCTTPLSECMGPKK